MTEEQKAKMAAGRAKKEVKTPDTIREDFEKFKEETTATNNKMLSILETLVNKDNFTKPMDIAKMTEVPKVPAGEEIRMLEGKQREVFENYFSVEDGFRAWYNVNENIFTIEVPMKLSNMIEAQRTMYKQDLRSKKVDQNNVLGSIDQWCRLVMQNIKYNKQIKLK